MNEVKVDRRSRHKIVKFSRIECKMLSGVEGNDGQCWVGNITCGNRVVDSIRLPFSDKKTPWQSRNAFTLKTPRQDLGSQTQSVRRTQ